MRGPATFTRETLRTLTAAGVPCSGCETAVRSILAERLDQAREWGGADHDDLHVPTEWVAFILKQLSRAADCAEPGSRDFRARLVKIAALALAALESQDRLGYGDEE